MLLQQARTAAHMCQAVQKALLCRSTQKERSVCADSTCLADDRPASLQEARAHPRPAQPQAPAWPRPAQLGLQRRPRHPCPPPPASKQAPQLRIPLHPGSPPAQQVHQPAGLSRELLPSRGPSPLPVRWGSRQAAGPGEGRSRPAYQMMRSTRSWTARRCGSRRRRGTPLQVSHH